MTRIHELEMKLPNLSCRQSVVLLVVVLVVTLFAGFYPKGYNFRNNVDVSDSGAGLVFRKYGVAYTDPVIGSNLLERLNDSGFEITLVLGPEAEEQGGFAFIVQIYSGHDQDQLVVGRWSDNLIVMNGDDYRNRLRHPRISAKLSEKHRRSGVELVVRSSKSGSMIYLDDLLVAERSDVILRLPSASEPARIVLGNSVYGTHSWSGEIEEFVLSHVGQRLDPLVRFSMRVNSDGIAPGNGAVYGDLLIPLRPVFMKHQFLAWPIDRQFEMNRAFVSDVVLNLFGFVPLGLVLALSFHRLGKRSVAVSIASAVVCSAGLSLLIETAQIWLPSRSSSSLDLLLNILGGLTGATLFVFAERLGTKT